VGEGRELLNKTERRWRLEGVHTRFRLCVRSVKIGDERRFQLVMALHEDPDSEFIPASQTAFAKIVPLKAANTSPGEAEADLRLLQQWLDAQDNARLQDLSGTCQGTPTE
jgi:hypothetical protein